MQFICDFNNKTLAVIDARSPLDPLYYTFHVSALFLYTPGFPQSLWKGIWVPKRGS